MTIIDTTFVSALIAVLGIAVCAVAVITGLALRTYVASRPMPSARVFHTEPVYWPTRYAV